MDKIESILDNKPPPFVSCVLELSTRRLKYLLHLADAQQTTLRSIGKTMNFVEIGAGTTHKHCPRLEVHTKASQFNHVPHPAEGYNNLKLNFVFIDS